MGARPRGAGVSMAGDLGAGAFDRTSLVAMVGDDPDVLRQLFVLYLDSCRDCADGLERAVEGGDVDGVSAQAHRLRSASFIVGARSLSRVAERLERAASECGDDGLPMLREMHVECRVELELALDWIREQLAQLPD